MTQLQTLPGGLLDRPISTQTQAGLQAAGREESHHHSHGSNGAPTPINKRTAKEVIAQLKLIPNVEKGHYAESFRDDHNVTADRSASTAIYYLLEGHEGYSRWHRLDAVELWHYYAGAPLTLSLARDDGSPVREVTLGPDIFNGQQPQVVVAKGEWQRARSLGDWTLVGTTVAPSFELSGFEMADPDWTPNVSR
ncbi:hypothetical protein VTH06DRAFT_4596 [Thermothelomyces fergusii]